MQSLNVNGTASTKNWMSNATWKNGVTLDFTLGSAASSWGSGTADTPPSYDSGTNPTSHTGPITSGIGTLQVNGKCLDVTGAGTANGTLVELWDCDGGGDQQWVHTGNTLVNPASGRYCDGGVNQHWTLS